MTPQFFSISDIGNSLSDCSQSMKKICIVEVFRANVLKPTNKLHFCLLHIHEDIHRADFTSVTPGGGGTPYSVLYGEAPPERGGAFFKLAVY